MYLYIILQPTVSLTPATGLKSTLCLCSFAVNLRLQISHRSPSHKRVIYTFCRRKIYASNHIQFFHSEITQSFCCVSRQSVCKSSQESSILYCCGGPPSWTSGNSALVLIINSCFIARLKVEPERKSGNEAVVMLELRSEIKFKIIHVMDSPMYF